MKNCDLIKVDKLLGTHFELVDTTAISNGIIRQRFCFATESLMNFKGSYIYLDMSATALNSSLTDLDDITVYTKFEDDEPMKADTYESLIMNISGWIYGYLSYANEANTLTTELFSNFRYKESDK